MTDSEKLDLILSRLDKVDAQLNTLTSDTQELKQRVLNVEDKVANVENKVIDIELTLENEISVNIKRIAEGHLDLSRNLHDALKVDNEKEMMAIRINILENEVRRIKEKLNDIA